MNSLQLAPMNEAVKRLWSGDRALMIGIIVSVLLHLVLLFMRFAPPEPMRMGAMDSKLDVILLNAQTDAKPIKPDAVAQANMEAGGDQEKGRATSPLVADTARADGDALLVQKRRTQELENQQKQLLAVAKDRALLVDPNQKADSGEANGKDENDVDQVIRRLQAQIDKQISDYNKRPRRLTYGVNAVGVSYARYVSDWTNKIEEIGTERYPKEARGKFYDSLIITVEIDKEGNVVEVILNKKSRYDALNKAVKQIVYAGAPYEKFTSEMIREGDILQIVRTWTFTNGQLEVEAPK
jgi:periplasmic protein TonB